MACGRPKKSDGKPCTLQPVGGYASCRSHMTTEEDSRRKAAKARMEESLNDPALLAYLDELLTGDPACWSWPVPAEVDVWKMARAELEGYPESALARILGTDEDAADMALHAWHAGRCAICGDRPDVTDHDHETGLVRGRLCRNCNTSEGRSDSPKLQKYRERHPAAILGVRVRYYNQFTREYAEPAEQVDKETQRAMLRSFVDTLSLPTPEDLTPGGR